jgi:hypothetical protein
MKIQILGSGCPKCKLLEQNAREASRGRDLGRNRKGNGHRRDHEHGRHETPALVLDGT